MQCEKLVVFNRDGLIEKEHYGYVVRCNRTNVIEKIGEDDNYPFYLRSCAKPLQASLLIDNKLDEEYNLTEEEIAICMASHAGEKVHIEVLKRLVEKFGLSEKQIKCGNQAPISRTAQDELLLKKEKPTVLHNNCSGKHIMMLGLCKQKDYSMDNYYELYHPLQVEIKEKIYKLCNLKKEYPVTKDGCGVPIYSMPLKNMVIGYLNLFCDEKYEKLKRAILNNPYILGGENRTDTKIVENSKNLIAKVGAGGLCIVINTELEEGFVVKIADADMQARELAVVDFINKLNWAKIEVSHDIKTLHDDKVGQIETRV